ncbi:MAG: tetratricopeptide repeat protein [Verrucomicrobiia bacterium]
MKNAWISLAAVCALVVGVYVYTAHEGAVTQPSLDAAGSYYNLLVQGFRAGQLNLKKEVPPGLAQLADPYTSTPLRPLGVMDLSYYRGKLYLYFGVTPAVVLFWPYVGLTGQYLFYRHAVTIFCAIGFLASVGILVGLWRRYFAEVSIAVVTAGVLALGLATFMPLLLARCEVWEVPISCGYMLTMLALAAIWKALHHPSQRGWWLAGASLAYGLAVGARPSLLFGAVILFVPVIQAWRERQRIWLSLVAATGPITLIGFGLLLYNVRRFDDPLEFGIHYQMTTRSHLHEQLFSLHYFWTNFRFYFLETASWNSRFPFVHRSFGGREGFGVLTNIPLTWLALAVPLAWRGRVGPSGSALRGFVIAVALLFGICALTIGLYGHVGLRYRVEFLPALVLLAVIGILSLERALAPTSESGQACRPLWRRAARWGYGLLLVFSVAFNLLASVQGCAEADSDLGVQLQELGQVQEAIRHYEQALRLYPDLYDAHKNLGNAMLQSGRIQEAIGHYEQALRIKPVYFEAHNNLGNALLQSGRIQEAIGHYEQALRIEPTFFEPHNNLGNALLQSGRIQEAIEQYKAALLINPDFADAHCNLGNVFLQEGKIEEAVAHFEQALRINPDLVEAHNSLGAALYQTGRREEAIEHFLRALAIKPDLADAHNNLGTALAEMGKIEQAIAHYEQALRIRPDFAEAHCNLGNALEQAGRVPEAILHYKQALKLRPDLTAARNALARLQAGR